jgi:hypothetical protein
MKRAHRPSTDGPKGAASSELNSSLGLLTFRSPRSHSCVEGVQPPVSDLSWPFFTSGRCMGRVCAGELLISRYQFLEPVVCSVKGKLPSACAEH